MLKRCLATALFALVSATSVRAQAPDVIKGKIVDDSSRAVAGATVMITRGPDRLVKSDTTDATGSYSVRFEQGTGDYLVFITAPGFKSVRRRVQREQAETEFTANFTLQKDLALLDTVKVRAQRPVRASNPISPTQPETGSNESWLNGVSGLIAPTSAGDLNSIAGTMPNVTITSTGVSILGSGAESNLTTLNGMGLASGSIPRAARTETRVTGATFDPTRGGFAGANIEVRLGPGSRNFQRRNAFLTFEPQQWQFADAISRAAGSTAGGVRGSFGADGELIRQALTYNVAVDFARNSSDPRTLINADAEALLRAGVSPDSVARLIALAAPLGLGLSGAGIPETALHVRAALSVRGKPAKRYDCRITSSTISAGTLPITTSSTTRRMFTSSAPAIAAANRTSRRVSLSRTEFIIEK